MKVILCERGVDTHESSSEKKKKKSFHRLTLTKHGSGSSNHRLPWHFSAAVYARLHTHSLLDDRSSCHSATHVLLCSLDASQRHDKAFSFCKRKNRKHISALTHTSATFSYGCPKED